MNYVLDIMTIQPSQPVGHYYPKDGQKVEMVANVGQAMRFADASAAAQFLIAEMPAIREYFDACPLGFKIVPESYYL